MYQLLRRKFFWLGVKRFLLLCRQAVQSVQLFAHIVERLLPIIAMIVDNSEKRIYRGRAGITRELFLLKLLQKYMKHIQIAVSQMDGRTLVPVKIQQRRRVAGTLPFQIRRLIRRGADKRHKWIGTLDRIVEHQAPFCDDVMTATGRAGQQFYEVKALAVHLFVGVETMIGHQYQRSLLETRRFLDRDPNPADQPVQVF